MPRRKKCSGVVGKIKCYVSEKRRLKKVEKSAYQKEKDRRMRAANAKRKKVNTHKAVARGRAKAAKIDISTPVNRVLKPSNVQTGIKMSLSPNMEKKAIPKPRMLETRTNPIIVPPTPASYVQVHAVKSGSVNKYPVTWKNAGSNKYNRLWFVSLQEARQFAAMKAREVGVRVSEINSELSGR